MPGKTGKRAKAAGNCRECGQKITGNFMRCADGDRHEGKCWEAWWARRQQPKRRPEKTPRKLKYEEHDKLRPHADKTNFTMAFIKEHCEPKGIFLSDKDGRAVCVEDLLYEFIGVDRWLLEDEKRAMVDGLKRDA